MSDIKSKAQGLDPNVQPRDILELVDKTGNIYESIAIVGKRARQISSDLKWEIQRKLEEFAVNSDTIEEIQENKEQIEISKFYERLPNTPLQFIVTGKVPSGQRKVSVKSSGTTILSPYWPVNMTLAQMAIQNIPNWLSGPNASSADTLLVTSGGSTTTFYHDGTNWRRTTLGNPISNTNVVPVGASIQITKRGNAAGFAEYQNTAPYSLQ